LGHIYVDMRGYVCTLSALIWAALMWALGPLAPTIRAAQILDTV
jgi:hypothetical protein